MLKYLVSIWLAAVTAVVFLAVPPAVGLGYAVRIMFFHIPAAWISVLGFLLAAWWAYRYLKTRDLRIYDKSSLAAKLGLAFCLAATVSGAIFAKLTWGAYWNWDPRQITIFILLLIYGAFITLELAISDAEQRAKISSVYALLAFITVPFLVFIIPRFYQSLHPDDVIINSSGSINMDTLMLMVLMAALIGITGLFVCLFQHMLQSKRKKNLQEEAGFDII